VGFFDLLENTSDVKGVVYPEEITSTALKARWQKHQLVELNPGSGEIDQELLWNQSADYVLYSPFDPLEFNLPSSTEKIPFLDYAEAHPLGRLEWIKVLGFLTNRREFAAQIFEQKSKLYQSQICQTKQQQKVVMGSWDGNTFYINGTKSTIHQTLIDAGYSSYDMGHEGTVEWDREMLWSKLSEIDHLIWITTTNQKVQLEKEMLQPESWQKKWGVIPHFILIDTCAYFQRAITEPEKLLQDLRHLNDAQIKTFVTN
jgi:iron complex transport system substrate-binding protein